MTATAHMQVGHAAAVEAFNATARPAVERAIAEAVRDLATGLAPIDAALASALDAEGARRWRPLLALAGAEAAGVRGPAALAAAVAMELTHTASLVLDDLPCMDDSCTRRGRAATHRQVGTAGAILVAVGLLGRSAELVGTSAGVWGRTIGLRGMSGGQAMDVALSGKARGAARRLMRRKTTVLAELSASVGASVGGAPRSAVRALEAFGRDLGWAYQLADDAADEFEDGAAGRSAGGLRPLRQAGSLLRRAGRTLRACPALSTDGVDLLEGMAHELVPAGWTA
jgi:geranylgeranyl diphosphate synthase type II